MLRMTAFIFAAIFFSFSSCKKNEKSKNAGVEDFSTHYSISSNFDPASSILTVKITMDTMLHAYAEGEKIGRPVRLEIVPKNGWSPVGSPIAPKGIKKDLPGLGESVILEGNFEVKQQVIKGQDPGEATLYLQVCTDNACDQPRSHSLTIKTI